MAIFGKNGFIRKQEVNFALKLLRWKYENQGRTMVSEAYLKAQAEQVVDEAHKIAKDRGSNVMTIMKDMVEDIKKKK